MKITVQYLAGLFDGEGTVGITPRYSNDARRGRLQLQIAVGNTDVRACRFFASAFGGFVYLNQKATARHKTYWIWTVTSQKAGAALRAMRPHMRLKTKDADIGIAFASHMKNKVGHRLKARDVAYRHRCRDRLLQLHGYASRAKITHLSRPSDGHAGAV